MDNSNAVFLAVIGMGIIYSVVHFVVIQYKKDYKSRTTYEKFITNAAIVGIALEFLGIIMGNNY